MSVDKPEPGIPNKYEYTKRLFLISYYAQNVLYDKAAVGNLVKTRIIKIITSQASRGCTMLCSMDLLQCSSYINYMIHNKQHPFIL